MIWHSTEISEVLKELEVEEKKGLANGVAEQRLEKYGENIVSHTEKPTFWDRLFAQLKSKIVILLIVLALLSFAVSLIYRVSGAYASLLIVAIVLVNAVVSAYNLHKCDNALDDMKNVTNPTVTVLREGAKRVVNSALLVPGDIILLEEGNYIPADARVIECSEFRCNESVLTGDEIPVEKNSNAVSRDITSLEDRENMVFSGTSVVHGTAKAVVVATGLSTEVGRTSSIFRQTGKQTLPLQPELDGVGKLVNIVILIVCVLVFVIGMIENFSNGNFADMTLKMLVNAAALGVAAIPEGLPAIATVVIAVGVQRLLQENILVKDADVLEKLAATNIICADKTGVLTRNKMVLSKIYDGDRVTDPETEELSQKTALVLRLAAACSTLRNDSTEDAIKNACLTYHSFSEKEIEEHFPKLNVIPFDLEKKMMGVITMIHDKPYAIVKGAPENVIPHCRDCKAEEIIKINNTFAEDALRTICIALAPLEAIPANPSFTDFEDSLTFVGLLGLNDPPRETVVENIAALKQAGIRTVMITGDHLLTAAAVARRIGILTDDAKAISGEELADITDAELAETITEYAVFARVSPTDKLRIIKAWKALGATVTITGDGMQDADALSAADVGCAVGRFGTDVAKGNADIVISHNRFDHIVCALKESRGLFDNIKKSVYYLLSCNLAELITVPIGMLLFAVSPLAAVQLLWINLLTDAAPSIALSMEKAENSVMKRKPGAAANHLFDVGTFAAVLIQCLFIAAMTLTAFAVGRKSDVAVAMTMAFGVLGLSEIFHCYNHKTGGSVINKALFSNRFMNFSAAATIVILLLFILTPVGKVFGLTSLDFGQFALCVLLAFLIVPVSEILKLLKRLTEKAE